MRIDAEHDRIHGDAPALDAVSAAGTAEPPPSKRKRRKGPRDVKPAPWMQPYVDKALERHKKRHPSPGVAVEPRKSGGYIFTATHSDLEAWEIQICDALGTRSYSLYRTFIQQLANMVGQQWVEDPGKGNGRWQPNERELNAALAIISGIRPRNEMEAALAAQMVAVHLIQMKLSEQALGTHGWVDPRTASVAAKAARTYTLQMDALAKARGKTGKQKITVKYNARHEHKHIHVHDAGTDPGVVDLEGQAIASRRPSSAQAVRQFIAGPPDVSPAREHGGGSEVRGENSFGCVVPIRGSSRQG